MTPVCRTKQIKQITTIMFLFMGNLKLSKIICFIIPHFCYKEEIFS